MCVFESCDRKPVAKGLCAKHYMRLRRAGNPNTVGKSGRKKSRERTAFEASGIRVGVDMSLRTFARFKQAMEMLQIAGCDIKPCIAAALRPNGTLNVSRLLEIGFIQLQIHSRQN